MFVKADENHGVLKDKLSGKSSKNSLKPRLINCPSFTIRARVGCVSYFTLKWFKKKFPEFFLAKTP